MAHVASTYTVSEQVKLPAMSTLTAPDGIMMVVNSTYTFDPDYMPLDSWDLDLTWLLQQAVAMSDYDAPQAGEYRYTYYIGGYKAAEVVFNLVDAPADDEAATGTDLAPATDTELDTEEAEETTENTGITYADGMIRVDLSGITFTGETRLYVQDVANSYTTSYNVTGEDTEAQLQVCPGRTYVLWLQDEGSLSAENTLVYYTVPESSDLYAAHSYAESAAYVTLADADDEPAADAVIPRVSGLTAAELQSGKRLYMQVISSYQTAEDADANLLIALYLQDGSCLLCPGGFTFEAALQEQDAWHVDLDAEFGDALQYTRQSGWTAGTYTLVWYMDGQLVNTLTFTIR